MCLAKQCQFQSLDRYKPTETREWVGQHLHREVLKVTSGAMDPALKVNDAIVYDDTIPFESLEIGDIIVFHRPSDHERMIVMRIVQVMDDDPLTFRTKGDANPASIPGTDYPITKEEYIGKVTEVIRTGEILDQK